LHILILVLRQYENILPKFFILLIINLGFTKILAAIQNSIILLFRRQ